MKNKNHRYFFPEEEYDRYIIGCFKKEDFVPTMLKEYGELCTDSPKISEFYKLEDWTIIPCPIQLLTRGEFLDLMGWLTQKEEEAFAIALHPEKNYFSKAESGNKYGDTAVVGFDDGTTIIWSLPKGLMKGNIDPIKYEVDPEILDPPDMLPFPCKEFLYCFGDDKLIKHFKL